MNCCFYYWLYFVWCGYVDGVGDVDFVIVQLVEMLYYVGYCVQWYFFLVWIFECVIYCCMQVFVVVFGGFGYFGKMFDGFGNGVIDVFL